jgi:hypothetical protein
MRPTAGLHRVPPHICRKMTAVVVLMFLVVAFAGCTAEDIGPEESPMHTVTDPRDFSYVGNKTGDGWHIHDYWNGQEVLRVLEGEDGCPGACTVGYGGERGAVVGSFRPPTDSVVPQGAAWIHVTAEWRIGDGEYGDVALFVKTANMSGTDFVTFLEPGVTVTIESTNDDNDPPHQRLSLWEFQIRALPRTGASQTTLEDFESYLFVEAERGLEIPPYPPHPDLWDGATEILLHEQTRVVQYQVETPTLWTCNGCLGRHKPDDGKIVPYDASHVEVVVEVKEGLPGTFGLMMRGADTWTFEKATPKEDGLLRLVWHLDVTDRTDSPYAKQSLWDLYLVNDAPVEMVRFWTGTYHVTVKAVR